MAMNGAEASERKEVRYEAVASDPTAVWRIVHWRPSVEPRDVPDRVPPAEVENEKTRSIDDLRQSKMDSTPEGNFKFPSPGLSVVVTGWDEDPMPCSSLATSTWNHQNPSLEPALVEQWPQNPKEYLSQYHPQYQVKQWNPNPSKEKILSAPTVDADLSSLFNMKIEQMEQTTVKATTCTVDGHNADWKPHQILDMTDDEADFHMKQGAFLYNFDAQMLPKSYHCFSRRLMLEYSKFSSLDSDEPFACKLNNPKHRDTYKQVNVHVLNYEAILWEKLPKFSMQQLYFVGLLGNLPPWPDLSFCKVHWMSMGMEKGAGAVSRRNVYNIVAGQSKNQFQPTRNKLLPDDTVLKKETALKPFIPVNFNLYWSLIVICYLGEVVGILETFEDGAPESVCAIWGTQQLSTSNCLNDSEEKLGMASGCILETGSIPMVVAPHLPKLEVCPPDKVNGAVEFCGVRWGQARNLLGKITYDPKSCAWMSVVNVINLDKRRKHNVTENYLLLLKKFKTKDRVKNVGASLVKQVANATNETAGDGTTCVTVLTKAIFTEGCKSAAAVMNAMDLRRGISMAVDAVVINLKSMARTISTSQGIAQVGSISANGKVVQKLTRIFREKVSAGPLKLKETDCKRFENRRFYEAVIQLTLQKAHTLDSIADVINGQIDVRPHDTTIAQCDQCYKIVMNTLSTLKGVGQSGTQRADHSSGSASALDPTSRSKYSNQLIPLSVQWPDTALHEHIYRTLIEFGLENELLEYGGFDLVAFL